MNRIVAVSCTILLLGTVALAGKVTLSEMISYDKLKNFSGGDDPVHEFTEKPDTVRIVVRTKLKRGEFAWRVENPAGKVLWKERASGNADIELKRSFPGEAGSWRVVLDYKEAKGSYYLKLEAVPREPQPS